MPELSDTSELRHHSFAGAMTGVLEYSIIYPIDFIKTRMQVLKPKPEATYPNVKAAVSGVIKEGGVPRFFRGMPAPFLASIPAHAAYYSVYEQCKRKLSGTEGGYHSPLSQCTAGALAVTCHNLIQNPADVIKQRMQVYGTLYESSSHCVRHIWSHEGPRAFYRSLPTQLSIDVPYGSMLFIIYESCQNFFNPSRTFDARSHIISGAIAGCVAAAVTNPLDVCRTLINLQESKILRNTGQSLVSGLAAAARMVHETHGIRGFARGLVPRIMFNMPKHALCWIIYEFFKRFLLQKEKKLSE